MVIYFSQIAMGFYERLSSMKKHENILNITDMIDNFLCGNSNDAYMFLGCHRELEGFVFRVWAPHARSVSVHGDFNDWDKNAPKMQWLKGGIWEGYVPNAVITAALLPDTCS